MKTIFSLVSSLICPVLLLAQTPKWDSTYRPGIYAMKVEQFRAFPNSPKDIIFLGNSITDYTDWNELLGLKMARNRGINDISRHIPDSVILANYKEIIRRIKKESPKTKIYFNTILPVNNTFTGRDHFNKDEHILFVNQELRKLGAAEGITVIDIHPHFLDAEHRLDKKYTYDGLHLDGEGYQKWATILKPYLK